MKHNQTIAKVLFLVPFIIMLANCASLNVSSMIPKAPESKADKLSKTLSVTDVTGGNELEVQNGIISVSNEKFKEALRISMKKSGIFGNVQDKDGDMALSACIKEQYLGFSKRGRTSVFIAEYRLHDEQANLQVWRETYHSECTNNNVYRGLECAIKTNITAMTQRLKEHLSSSPVTVSKSADQNNLRK
jgi:hypothetical protein